MPPGWQQRLDEQDQTAAPYMEAPHNPQRPPLLTGPPHAFHAPPYMEAPHPSQRPPLPTGPPHAFHAPPPPYGFNGGFSAFPPYMHQQASYQQAPSVPLHYGGGPPPYFSNDVPLYPPPPYANNAAWNDVGEAAMEIESPETVNATQASTLDAKTNSLLGPGWEKRSKPRAG